MFISAAALVLSASIALSADSSPPPLAGNSEELAVLLRGFLADNLPETLFERDVNWGQQRKVPALRFDGVRPTIRHPLKNDGIWKKIRFTTNDLKQTLDFRLGNWQHLNADVMRFNMAIAFDAKVHYEQQSWESGVRLLSTSARARMRVRLNLVCEVVMRTETKASELLPDLVFRLRVVQSDLDYDDVVFEHLAGMGGTGARWMGELVHGAIQTFRPSLEENLKDRANTAIVRAADTREVRVGLGSLLKTK